MSHGLQKAPEIHWQIKLDIGSCLHYTEERETKQIEEILKNYEHYGNKLEAELKINGIGGYLNENDLRGLIALASESGKKARSMWRDQNVHSLEWKSSTFWNAERRSWLDYGWWACGKPGADHMDPTSHGKNVEWSSKWN